MVLRAGDTTMSLSQLPPHNNPQCGWGDGPTCMQLDPHTCGKPQIHKGQSEHRGEVLSSMRARAVFLEEEPRELSLKEQAGVGLARYRGV